MFWIISAILVLLALAFILPSLLQRNNTLQDAQREQNIYIANEQLEELEARLKKGEVSQEDYQSSRDELEQALYADVSELEEPLNAVKPSAKKGSLLGVGFIALLVPAIAIPVYLKVGNPVYTTSFDSKLAAKEHREISVPKNADGTPDIDTMVAGLQKKMEADPTNAKGWFMLGRSYMVLKRYDDATKSYEKALKLRPDSADIMLSLADSLAMTNNGTIVGRPVELINEALKVEPDNLTALWLGGMASRQSGDSLTAVKRWRKVLAQTKDPQEQKEVTSLIDEALTQLTPEQKASLGETMTTKPASQATKVSEDTKNDVSNSSGIGVKVSLSPELKSKVKPTDIVFVYAKALSGPPMPLAAAKVQVKDLPYEVILDDSMAMIPTMKLSAFKEVAVGARVSFGGQPVAQNGDLFTEKKPVIAGQEVSLEIDQVLSK